MTYDEKLAGRIIDDQAAEIERLRDHMRALANTSIERNTAGIFQAMWQEAEKERTEAAAEIERLRDDYSILKADYDAQRAEIERLREEVKQTRMRIADLEKQLFRATGRTP